MTDAVSGVDPAEGSATPEPSAPNIVTLASGHIVTLHPAVTMAIGIAAAAVLKRGSSEAIAAGRTSGPEANIETGIIEGALSEVYLRTAILSWTFRDKEGNAEDITPENIARLLPYGSGGLEVAEAAEALYSAEVMRPFQDRQAKFLQAMQTGRSMPPTRPIGSMPRTHSKRSSRNGTAGKRSEVRAR